MDRSEILAAARQAVVVDRVATHGDAEASFAAIAGGWNWWLEIRRGGALTPVDVGAMMILFKLARAAGNPGHADSWVDMAGYAACTGELALAAGQPDPVQAGYDDLADRRMDQPTMDAGAAQVTGFIAVLGAGPAGINRSGGAIEGGQGPAGLGAGPAGINRSGGAIEGGQGPAGPPELVPATLPPWLADVAQAVSRSPAARGPSAKRKPSPRRVVRLGGQIRWDAALRADLAQRVLAGQSNAVIAAALGETPKAVANRVYRLRLEGGLPAVPQALVGPEPEAVPRPEPAVVPVRVPAPAAVPERIEAHPVEAQAPAAFWTPARDLDLVERLGRGEGLVDIAADYGIELRQCRERFRGLSAGFRDDHDRLPIGAMPKLLAALRAQVEVSHG